MDKVAVDIMEAHDNNRAFVTLERAQNTFELMACTKHKHMTTDIDVLFALSHGFGRVLENVDHHADEQHGKDDVARQETFPAKRLFAKHPRTKQNADDKDNQGKAK